MKVHFSDWFGIAPEVLEDYGAFNGSLIGDLPLFIDPFLLFSSDRAEYRGLHEHIIEYLKFLRDQSHNEDIDNGLLKAWYKFPEVKQLWLGFSQGGNRGRGLGMNFAKSLNRSLNLIFSSFGKEHISRESHLEKLTLIRSGVGRDNISDFTANLIKEFLAIYSQNFAKQHLKQKYRRVVSVAK